MFGSNVAWVLRRLRRVARRYGADPVFVLASATTADPGEAASRLIGAPCAEVTEDASPHGPRTVALWASLHGYATLTHTVRPKDFPPHDAFVARLLDAYL